MNQILIVSEHDEISTAIEQMLTPEFRFVQDNPDYILIAARSEFSFLFTMKEKMQQEFQQTPMLFLWIEESCMHILSCSNLQYMDGRTIPKTGESLLAYLTNAFSAVHDNSPAQTQKLTEIQTGMRNHFPKERQGALKVEYDNFTSIFEFVEQLARRSGQYVQMLLLSLIPSGLSADESGGEFRLARELLTEAVQQTLRKNDVLTGCSESQMLVLLMDADDDGGHFAANRICNTFFGLYDGNAYTLHYDVKPVGNQS